MYYNFQLPNEQLFPPYYYFPQYYYYALPYYHYVNPYYSGYYVNPYGWPFWAGPMLVYQHHQDQYNQHINRYSGTESQYAYQYKHESIGTIGEDRSTGIHPGHARIDANFDTGVGEVWRTPSKNPLMVDRNLT